MNVALIGASGFIGSEILNELLSRGHKVTAIVRNPEKIKSQENLIVKKGDATDAKQIEQLVKGNDAVITAHNPYGDMKALAAIAIVTGVRNAGIKRLLAVGGAGTLEVAPGKRLVDTPEFPAEWKNTALATAEVYNYIKAQNDLDWTVLSPAAMIEPGARTGKFRLGKDTLVTDSKGESRISTKDYAVAMVDELEKGQHIKQRFTLAY